MGSARKLGIAHDSPPNVVMGGSNHEGHEGAEDDESEEAQWFAMVLDRTRVRSILKKVIAPYRGWASRRLISIRERSRVAAAGKHPTPPFYSS